jgi:hypothetical protein
MPSVVERAVHMWAWCSEWHILCRCAHSLAVSSGHHHASGRHARCSSPALGAAVVHAFIATGPLFITSSPRSARVPGHGRPFPAQHMHAGPAEGVLRLGHRQTLAGYRRCSQAPVAGSRRARGAALSCAGAIQMVGFAGTGCSTPRESQADAGGAMAAAAAPAESIGGSLLDHFFLPRFFFFFLAAADAAAG